MKRKTWLGIKENSKIVGPVLTGAAIGGTYLAAGGPVGIAIGGTAGALTGAMGVMGVLGVREMRSDIKRWKRKRK